MSLFLGRGGGADGTGTSDMVVENSISVDLKSGHYLNALLSSSGDVHLGSWKIREIWI